MSGESEFRNLKLLSCLEAGQQLWEQGDRILALKRKWDVTLVIPPMTETIKPPLLKGRTSLPHLPNWTQEQNIVYFSGLLPPPHFQRPPLLLPEQDPVLTAAHVTADIFIQRVELKPKARKMPIGQKPRSQMPSAACPLQPGSGSTATSEACRDTGAYWWKTHGGLWLTFPEFTTPPGVGALRRAVSGTWGIRSCITC